MNTQQEMQAHAKQLELSQKALAAMADKIIADIIDFKVLLNSRRSEDQGDRAWSDANYALEFMGSARVGLSK